MISTEGSASDLDVFPTLVGDYLDIMAGDHDSTHDEGSLTVFDVEEPLEPSKMVRATEAKKNSCASLGGSMIPPRATPPTPSLT